MPIIRPVSDLRSHFEEITKEVQLSREPVFLTKDGVGHIVVLSIESYEQNRYDIRVYDKLREAELQATSTMKHRSHEDVMARAKALLDEAEELKRA